MAEENVKVAVRVRPFNQREIDAKSKLVVAMDGNQTMVTNPKTSEEKKYAFDYSYWSHDGFKEVNGYAAPDNAKYIDQKKVFDDLGAGVLANAWNGFNASLFAYGQTGSGKSYSVVGYGQNKGIVPLVCEDIFNQKAKMASNIQVEVTFSMMEIYSEIARDLLNPKQDKKIGMTIREDPKIGFFAQGLQKTLVGSYAEITKLMDQGTANRTIASTNMNATSSRAHTIVTVTLVQKYKNDAGKEMAKTSQINLVDLAGSERADATGATGDRLKEGAAINLSLTSLGNVISALAENSSGKNVKVPYRDSVLTKLLMNALGGNSKTIMIAAISPADINYDETVSTLRYADRAKQIKTKAVVNEDPTEKLIHDLKEENARLKKMLEGGNIQGDKNLPQTADSSQKEEEALKKQVEENEKAMKAMQLTYEEKLAAARQNTDKSGAERAAILEKAKKTPHFKNVNMDPWLSGTIITLLEGEGVKKIGKPGKADVTFNGVGILDEHATFAAKGGHYTLNRLNDGKVLVNGKPITKETEINHMDRIVFGTSQYLTFIDPAKASVKDHQITFESMQDEISKAAGIVSSDNKNMTQDEIQGQNELVDLLPSIEEANQISIALDKKVCYIGLPVSADARGDYNHKYKAYVLVKNFALGLEWIWTKQKFLDRKVDIAEMYQDFMDDGVINREKFKNYDPFYESPDTPYQVGTAIVLPKSFAYMMVTQGDYKIISLKSKEAGSLNVEIIPCNAKGEPIDLKTSDIEIHDPKSELLGKTINFILKINELKSLPGNFDDVFCQFTVFNDTTVYKTSPVKAAAVAAAAGGTKQPANNGGVSFKIGFSKQFTFVADEKFLDLLLNNSLYIQIWADQKKPTLDPASAKISTKEYFEREKEMSNRNMVMGKDVLNNAVDPEKQKLKDDLNICMTNERRNNMIITNVYRLMQVAGPMPIPADLLHQVMCCRDENLMLKLLQTVHGQVMASQQKQAQPQQQQMVNGAPMLVTYTVDTNMLNYANVNPNTTRLNYSRGRRNQPNTQSQACSLM